MGAVPFTHTEETTAREKFWTAAKTLSYALRKPLFNVKLVSPPLNCRKSMTVTLVPLTEPVWSGSL